jgi:spore coat polysaccharide biosynthesis protein SpsF (cytidylyltransferase family)
MATHTFERVTDDEAIEILVDLTVRPGSAPQVSGPPEACDPGEPAEVEILGAEILATGEATTLTPEEIEKVELYVAENPDEFDPGYPDPSDYMDF